MARHTRKGRNPGPVDEWLDTLGFYRKNVAYDETCLFRAVSEQIFGCQLFHEKIRGSCIDYARGHHAEFKHLMPKRSDWWIYLDQLTKHMAICGNLEIQIISKTFKKNILLFDGINRCMKELTADSYPTDLLLCHMGEDHYDVVHKREYIQDAGFCQSIIYNVLYENVFGIPKVTSIVQAMLYQKTPFISYPVEYISEDANNNDGLKLLHKDSDEEENHMNDYDYMLKTNIAPFPFKVAKALDPTIYRNIEYDTWTEMRKEMRLGDWYYGDNNLIQGSGCVLKENGIELHCYIQDISKDDDRCTVYITKRAEKRNVRLSELLPENDAKPWPLPYRFSKNLVLTIPKVEIVEKKSLRKRRVKKTSISKCSNDSESQTENVDGNVSAFEGAPLQMHSDLNTYDQENTTVETPHLETQFSYNEPTWETSVPVLHTPEPVIWSQPPLTPQNVVTFSPKPVMQTTPEVYPDQHYYYPDQNYPRYNVWTNGEYVPPAPVTNQLLSPHPTVEVPQSSDIFNFYYSDANYSTSYFNSNTPISPSPQQVEMYPPIYSAPPPGTPIILAPAEMTEIVMPTPPPHMLYTPTIEMPYMTSSPFIYPPTPPAAWYHSAINSQGFIFPTISPSANNISHIK